MVIVQGPDVTSHICSEEGGIEDVEDDVLVGPEISPVYNKRFGESVFASLTTSGVAAKRIRSETSLGVRFGSFCSMSAAAPATCGHAAERAKSHTE
jgi:hypothetical protein